MTGSQTQHSLEVLAFPEQPLKESTLELQVPCIFCDREFPNTTGKNDAVLHHLLVEHQLVIGEVAQVCDMRRYVLIHYYRQLNMKNWQFESTKQTEQENNE